MSAAPETELTSIPNRYVVCPLDGDLGYPVMWAIPASTNLPEWMKTAGNVGVGNPFWAFENISTVTTAVASDPDGYGADWTGAPICSSDTATNAANIAAAYASPPLVGPVTGSKVWGVNNPPPA
jgi:hypothetical protein